MRYKNNVNDRLTSLDAVASRLEIQVSRGTTKEEFLRTIENLKEQIEGIREIISVEPDDFEQQFAPRM